MIATVLSKREMRLRKGQQQRVRVLGKNTVGLIRYLFGPGRFNEHSRQRVIAASETFGIVDGTRLDFVTQAEGVRELGIQLDSYRQALGITLPQGHLWHCAISLPPTDSTPERRLTDEQWAEVVREIVTRLGFESADASPCRWVAVHHGKSVEGNEHVHLVVNIVREDGSIASLRNDFYALSDICRDMEQRYGLTVVEGRATAERGRIGKRGVSRAQIERSSREGKSEPDQARLERIVRGALAVAVDEADFVHQLRVLGALVRPRYGGGGQDSVVGYSLALRTGSGYEPIWFGGGRLHPDLSLPKLRARYWPETTASNTIAEATDAEESYGARNRALAAWASGIGPAVRDLSAVSRSRPWSEASAELMAVRVSLRDIPDGDIISWAAAAREASGLLALWSERIEEGRRGPLAQASDALAHSSRYAEAVADTLARRDLPRASRRGTLGGNLRLQTAAEAIATAKPRGRRGFDELQALRELLQLLREIERTAHAQTRAQAAIERAEATITQLARLEASWTAALPTPANSSPSMPPPTPRTLTLDRRMEI